MLNNDAQPEITSGPGFEQSRSRGSDVTRFNSGRASATMVHKLGWSVALVVCAAYVVWLFCLSSFPFQDYPNHLARGLAIADLLFGHGARFGHTYALELAPAPYVLHDLLLAVSIELFGVQAGGALFAGLVFLSMPLALLFYLHATRLAPRAQLFIFLISLYLTTDWFFLMAFMGFRLALALIIVSLALVETLRRRWSWAIFGIYVLVVTLGYLTHLAAPVFFAIALGVSALLQLAFRASSVRRELYLLAPVMALLSLHFGVVASAHPATHPAGFAYYWGTWHKKAQHLLFEFGRLGGRPATAMPLLLAACLLWPLRNSFRAPAFMRLSVLQPLAIAVAFLGVYCVLPSVFPDSAYVDVRALAVVALMLILTCLNLPDESTAGRTFATPPVLALAGLLAVGNLAYLVRHVGRNDTFLAHYRDVAAAIPRGAYVLPIHTKRKEGEIYPFLHAGSFLVMDRDAVIPYLFSADRGDAMSYFRYTKRPYMPEEDWYEAQLDWDSGVEQTYVVQGRPYTWRFKYSKLDKEWELLDLAPVDWNRIACGYDYLMVTLPVDMSMIGVPTKQVRANDAATLLAVDKGACRPNLMVTHRVRLGSEH